MISDVLLSEVLDGIGGPNGEVMPQGTERQVLESTASLVGSCRTLCPSPEVRKGKNAQWNNRVPQMAKAPLLSMGVRDVFWQNKRQGVCRKTENEGECFCRGGVSLPNSGRWKESQDCK